MFSPLQWISSAGRPCKFSLTKLPPRLSIPWFFPNPVFTAMVTKWVCWPQHSLRIFHSALKTPFLQKCCLTSWVGFQAYLVPGLDSVISVRSMTPCSGEGIRDQVQRTGCPHCYWSAFASWLFQWTELGNICLCMHTYIHTHICIFIHMYNINMHIHILEIMNLHWYLLTELFLALPTLYLYVPPSVRILAPNRINIFAQSYITSKVVYYIQDGFWIALPTPLQTADLPKGVQDLFPILPPPATPLPPVEGM